MYFSYFLLYFGTQDGEKVVPNPDQRRYFPYEDQREQQKEVDPFSQGNNNEAQRQYSRA